MSNVVDAPSKPHRPLVQFEVPVPSKQQSQSLRVPPPPAVSHAVVAPPLRIPQMPRHSASLYDRASHQDPAFSNDRVKGCSKERTGGKAGLPPPLAIHEPETSGDPRIKKPGKGTSLLEGSTPRGTATEFRRHLPIHPPRDILDRRDDLVDGILNGGSKRIATPRQNVRSNNSTHSQHKGVRSASRGPCTPRSLSRGPSNTGMSFYGSPESSSPRAMHSKPITPRKVVSTSLTVAPRAKGDIHGSGAPSLPRLGQAGPQSPLLNTSMRGTGGNWRSTIQGIYS